MSFAKSARNLSGLPLGALPAIALDTETTGLDVERDRIIEIAALRLGQKSERPGTDTLGSATSAARRRGAADPATADKAAFVRLVNPGRPIPPAATDIHGITDNQVAQAAAFAPVMAALADWAGPVVLVGYAIGFDLAILKAEHQRHDLVWNCPRSIDVRHLVQLVAPDLPNYSLETTADWLGVAIHQRHRALSDATAAAEIFQALIPRLRGKGILTLAQAERLTRNQTARLEMESRAGWHQHLDTVQSLPDSVAEFARVDAFPYRHRVADIMHRPAIAIPGATSMTEALALMVREATSSVFVLPETAPGVADGRPPSRRRDLPWILTERDVLRALDRDAAAALSAPVSRYANGPLVTVASDEFVYRAIASMALHGFRHLGVRDPDGSLAGALSARDLLRQRASDALSLGSSIETAESADELGEIWADLTTVAQSLAYEEVDPRDIAAIISRELRSLTRRAGELAARDLARQGSGEPPQPYALLLLGSGGRGESLLAMDQDNALIFQDGAPGGAADRWFEQFGQKTADMLNAAGVRYCDGGIMASNAAWRKDLAGWRRQVESWIGKARLEDMLNVDIFFDAVAVQGACELAEDLSQQARALAQRSKGLLQAMTLNTSDLNTPLNWLGRPRLKAGRIDLKLHGLLGTPE